MIHKPYLALIIQVYIAPYLLICKVFIMSVQVSLTYIWYILIYNILKLRPVIALPQFAQVFTDGNLKYVTKKGDGCM